MAPCRKPKIMPIEKIRRRDGEVIPFDRRRIERAIELACDAVAVTDKAFIPELTDEVIKDVERVYSEIFVHRVPTVEDIQDIVERELVKSNRFDLAKTYILYREERKKEREERHERLVREFEEKTLKVTKSDESKEYFDVKKLRVVFDRAAKGYEEECRFEDLMDSFKKNLVDDIRTSDIETLLVKTCIDLVTVENISWQNIAARILLGGLYKKATKNRGSCPKRYLFGSSLQGTLRSLHRKGSLLQRLLPILF
jgi:ribonucleoside-diphosphate reductase alpha chain